MDAPSRAFDRYRRHGDARALGEVFDELAPRLLSLALHLCPRPADAEDLLQETFVRAMQAAHQFDAARPVEPWLCGLMANAAQNLRRREARRQHTDLGDVAEPAVAGGGPYSQAERRDLVATLRTHIDGLPAEQRQVLLLQLQHGLSPVEIGEVLAVPAGTIRMRLLRGLRALRRLLPAGLAALLGLGVEGRGLAAVRAQVLSRAAARPAAVGAAVLLGAAAWKYLAAVGALLLLAIGAAVALGTSRPEQLPASASATGAVTARLANAPHAGTLGEQTIAKAEERREVASAPTARRLSVHVTGRLRSEPESATEPLPGAVVTVYRDHGQTRVTRSTDAAGDTTFDDLAPGVLRVKVDILWVESAPRDVDVTAADAAFDVTLVCDARIKGI